MEFTKKFLRAKSPCADGFRWFSRHVEDGTGYQEALDTLVNAGRVEDACWLLGQSIAIMGQKLGQAELARADVIIRPQVLDMGSTDFSQRANAIVEGEKAALAAMPQLRARVAQLLAERAQAARLAQQKTADAQHQACLENRSRLQKLAGTVGLDSACAQP